MGFSMICANTGKSCCYTTWFEQRVEITKIVVKYLENRIDELKKEIQEKHDSNRDLDDEDNQYINGFHIGEYNYYINTITNNFIKPIKEATNNDTIFRIVTNPQNYHIKDVLCCFGIYGIHLLCRQGDCGGVYTIGESMEILHMLNTIKPYFDTESEIYVTVYTINNCFSSSIYDIFNDSVTSLQPIRIT